MIKTSLALLFLCALSACNMTAPDISRPGAVVSTGQPDIHGVVCYNTRFQGEFSCVKVK